MAKIVLVTGGSRSGKSVHAEGILRAFDDVLYVATAVPFDAEMRERVSAHRARRNTGWKTLEAYRDLGRLIPAQMGARRHLLLDCVTVMVSNIMVLDYDIDWDRADVAVAAPVAAAVREEMRTLSEALTAVAGMAVVVTGEVGMGIVPPTPLGRRFRDLAGEANQHLAAAADEVYLVVSGIPVKIKG